MKENDCIEKEEIEEKDCNEDKGFYTHMTHASLQKNEDSVQIIGDGFGDSYLPKSPKTAKI